MRHDESRAQQACVKWFRLQYPQYARLLFAVPNGGARGRVTGAILKAEGVVAGVADLLLLIPNNIYHGLCVEMKTQAGRQSEAQREWQRDVEGQGYKYVVAHSFDEFEAAVLEYLTVSK